MADAADVGEFRAIEPQVRQLLCRAGVETDEPDQVVRGLLMLTAVAIVRLARANGLSIGEAWRVASIAGQQLPRMVVQVDSAPSTRGGEHN